MSNGQRVVLNVLAIVFLLVPGFALADPCLMVYSDDPVTYHYDPTEYYTVTFGDPLYDPFYDRGGEVLIDINNDQIALDVYQAPNLVGFVMDAENQGYFLVGTDFTAIVDGFNNAPITYINVLLVFDRFEPDGCVPVITVDGNPVLFDPGLGYYWPAGDLVVSTPTAEGNNFSDTMSFLIEWEGCFGVRTYAFADENFNLVDDGGECFSAYSHDLTVPTETKTWGAIKNTYSNDQ
jgi:hypothetical protein